MKTIEEIDKLIEEYGYHSRNKYINLPQRHFEKIEPAKRAILDAFADVAQDLDYVRKERDGYRKIAERLQAKLTSPVVVKATTREEPEKIIDAALYANGDAVEAAMSGLTLSAERIEAIGKNCASTRAAILGVFDAKEAEITDLKKLIELLKVTILEMKG